MSNPSIRVEVDQDICIGAGQCEALAAHLFEVSDEGLSHVIGQPTSEDDRDLAEQAEDACPSGAIRVLEE